MAEEEKKAASKTTAKKPAASKSTATKASAAKSEGAKAASGKTSTQSGAAKSGSTKAAGKSAPKPAAKAQAPAKGGQPAAKKATAKAPAKQAGTDRRRPGVRKAPNGPTVTVTQTGSPIGRQGWQRKTLIGLGLNKMHRTSVLEDTPVVRGMIEKVKHLVRVEQA